MKSSKYKSNLFFLIWGGGFGGIPLVVLLIELLNEETQTSILSSLPFLMIFVVIGMSAFFFGVWNLIMVIKIHFTDTKGEITEAEYVETLEIPMNRKGNNAQYTIKFKFKNKAGKEILQKSIEEFTQSQIKNIKRKKTFKIRRLFNFAVMVPYDWGDNDSSSESQKLCDYCDSYYEGKKCPYCGAKKNKK